MKKISYLAVCAFLISFGFVSSSNAQDRQRLIKTISSRPINEPPSAKTPSNDKTRSLSSSTPLNSQVSRPTLTNKIEIANTVDRPSLVKKTGASSPLNVMTAMTAARTVYGSNMSVSIMNGIQSRWGIPYLYGSSGPNRYDCSGFVWAVFNDAGISFPRESARTLWAMAQPVTGEERFKFGTLVFLNGLGHMGIVADENGFYHASSSKGITYSPFKGYWESRIVGFRRLVPTAPAAVEVSTR
ncbi:MAG: C40 family peptidase [Acidobacteriota bacterium]